MTKEYGPLPGSQSNDPVDKPDLPVDRPAPPIVNRDRSSILPAIKPRQDEDAIVLSMIQDPEPAEAEEIRNAINRAPMIIAYFMVGVVIAGCIGVPLYYLIRYIWTNFITRNILYATSILMITVSVVYLIAALIGLAVYGGFSRWDHDDLARVKRLILSIPVAIIVIMFWIIVLVLSTH